MASRILLADDSITIQKVVNLTFADEGIDVVAVSNGEMAARRLDEVNPDLVLADIFMPGKNGYELCETIKTNPKFRNVPVVLLVGAFEPFDQAEAKRVQADAHLTKPFEPRTLVETVRKLLGKADGSRSAPLVSAPLTAPEPQTFQYEEPHALTTPELVEAPVDASRSVDSESASGEWRPVDMPAHARGSTDGETLPLGDISVGESLNFHSVEIQPSSNEVTSDVPAWERPTGELVSPPGHGHSSIQTGLSEVHEPADTAANLSFELPPSANDQAGEPRRLEIETQSWPAATPSQPALDQQQMVVDFEESLPSNPAKDSDVVMVDAIPPSVHLENVQTRDSNEWHVEEVEQAATEWKAANARNLKTTTLEMPEMSVSSRASLEGTGEAPGLFSFSEAPATAESNLFTADEPLGDVLFDDATESLPSAPSGLLVPVDEPALTEFSLELAPDDTTPVEQPPESQASSTRITGELVTAELPLEGQKLVEYAAQDFVGSEVFEQPAEAVEQWADHEPQTTSSPQPVSADSVNLESVSLESATPESVNLEPLSEEGSVADSVAYDWTSPGAVAHSTGRLDSMVMPVEFTEPPAEVSAHEADTPQTPVDEAPVNEPVNWEAEQMGFAAIDVEASPAGEHGFSVQDFDSSDPERGFEIARALVDDQAAESHENGHRQPAEAPLTPVELSPMVIDEIVRRVVAQIGDSVVREIAWEIVPDCVERIIEQQTREALSKR